jgi:hypothetical protein
MATQNQRRWVMRMTEQVSAIETKEDLATFVSELRQDLLRHPDEWQNLTLDHYLESLSAWLADMAEDYFESNGARVPETPSWRALGEMLLAGKYYE